MTRYTCDGCSIEVSTLSDLHKLYREPHRDSSVMEILAEVCVNCLQRIKYGGLEKGAMRADRS